MAAAECPGGGVKRYAVSLVERTPDGDLYRIEFYEADDLDHAVEQAVDANPDGRWMAVAEVPEAVTA